MPRSGSEAGYDPVNVCSFCIEPLTSELVPIFTVLVSIRTRVSPVTASSRNQLRTTSVAKLRQYLKAFNISTPGALEKDDIVQAVLAARQPNGCLPPELESYYRKNSVPDQRRGRPERRSFLDRASDAAQAARHAFQEATGNPQNQNPNRDPGLRPPNSQRPPRPSSQPPPQTRPPPPPTNTRPQQVPRPQQQYAYPQYGHPYASPPRAPPRPTPTTAQQTRPPTAPARTPRPPTPIPPLSSLLDKTTEELNALSVHVLKEILHQNHVNARLLLEKSDLVDRVKMLIDDERREREREEEMRRLEEQEAIDLQHRMMAELRAREQERERLMREQAAAASAATAEASQTASGEASSAAAGEGTTEATPPSPGAPEDQTQESKATPTPAPAPAPPKPAPLPHVMERSGLCVVCQDADANMALTPGAVQDLLRFDLVDDPRMPVMPDTHRHSRKDA
ncbi:hypothetical protein FRC00_010933 [Tulasnella sp. 408]|nr:hypothetical protein FRC00_010933 [Tulasnella sp. 408]